MKQCARPGVCVKQKFQGVKTIPWVIVFLVLGMIIGFAVDVIFQFTK